MWPKFSYNPRLLSLNIETQNHSRQIGISDLNSLAAILLKFTPTDHDSWISAHAWDKEKKKHRGRERETIRSGNGYLAKTKLDFYGGQVLIKFGKLEENLGEHCRHPRAILRLLLPSTFRISPCLASPWTPPRSFSHFPLCCRENSISRKWASWHVC